MVEPDAESKPAIHPDTAWVEIDGEIVAIDPMGSEVHLIDPQGSLLFPLLDGESTVAELAADVADVFGLDPDQALADVLTLVRQMMERRLLVR